VSSQTTFVPTGRSKWITSEAAGRLATETYSVSYVARREATENKAWEEARHGAPGSEG